MRAKITYEGDAAIERYFVPEEALREALLNALCHKQYQSGVPNQISVYEDKLYIANCGCLPENWTLENLMNKHASSPYNPNIAMCSIWRALLRAGAGALRKSARPVKRTVCRSRNIRLTPVTL